MIEDLLRSGVEDRVFPGAAYAVSRDGALVQGAVGRFTYDAASREVGPDTIWDLASVSKVVGTTTAAMILFEEGVFDLDRPVAEVTPEFGQNGKGAITFRNLLVHDAGLVAFRRYQETCSTRREVLDAIYAEALEYPTGTDTVYSDLGLIVLGEAIARLTGEPLDAFLARRVFGPLGMTDTLYRPGADRIARCAPTEAVEPWRRRLRELRGTWRDATYGAGNEDGRYIQGEVHDPTAAVLGGVAGHAGLFSTVGDLARYMAALTSGRIVGPETLEFFATRQSETSSRGLGWDTKSEPSSAGPLFGSRTFGHLGFTGASIWCDPDQNLWAILLANRVHPTAENPKMTVFRPRFYEEAARIMSQEASKAP